jgi:hypothetical protein
MKCSGYKTCLGAAPSKRACSPAHDGSTPTPPPGEQEDPENQESMLVKPAQKWSSLLCPTAFLANIRLAQ